MDGRRPTFPQVEGQHGVATTSQLATAGYTRSAIRHALEREWRTVRSGVVVPHRGPVDADVRLAAAALWAGEFAVLTGTVALARHGLEPPTTQEAVFLVPSTARSRRDGPVRTVRTTRPIQVARELGCVAITSVERALLDASAHQDVAASDLKALTLAALQRRMTTVERLQRELGSATRRGSSPVREALAAFVGGAWSLPEDSLRKLVATAPDLPRMLMNVELREPDGTSIGVPDGFFPDAGVAVQVHSRQFHSGYDSAGTDLWSRTVERDATYAQHGIICVGLTPRSIEKRPQQILERICAVVLRRVGADYGPVDVVRRDALEAG